jgi:DNA-binding transcriptional MerR regulator
MRKNRLKLKLCGKFTAIVILLSLLTTSPVYAEPSITQPPNLTESGTRLYSDYEIELLIDALTEAAHEEIQKAAAEAAKEAVLSVIEREAIAMREATLQQAEALRWRLESERQMKAVKDAKRAGIKNAIIAGAACLLSGLAVGIGGTLIIGGR